MEHRTEIVENTDDTVGWRCSCGDYARYYWADEAEAGADAHERGEPDPYAQP